MHYWAFKYAKRVHKLFIVCVEFWIPFNKLYLLNTHIRWSKRIPRMLYGVSAPIKTNSQSNNNTTYPIQCRYLVSLSKPIWNEILLRVREEKRSNGTRLFFDASSKCSAPSIHCSARALLTVYLSEYILKCEYLWIREWVRMRMRTCVYGCIRPVVRIQFSFSFSFLCLLSLPPQIPVCDLRT